MSVSHPFWEHRDHYTIQPQRSLCMYFCLFQSNHTFEFAVVSVTSLALYALATFAMRSSKVPPRLRSDHLKPIDSSFYKNIAVTIFFLK